MYFSLFLDESGKVHQRGFAALCGYVATVEDWGTFGNMWGRLQMKWGLPALHMSKVMAPERDKGWESIRRRVTAAGDNWEDWRDNALNEFCALIANSNIVSVGSVISTDGYSSVKRESPEDFLIAHADCNVYLFQHALMAALDTIERVDKSGILMVCIDDDQEHAFDYYKSYWNLQRLIENPNVPPELKDRFERVPRRVDQLSFCKDTFHPALQAADILAYVSRRFKTEELGAEKERFNDLYACLTRGGTHPIQDYPESAIRKVADNTARTVREMRNEANCLGL